MTEISLATWRRHGSHRGEPTDDVSARLDALAHHGFEVLHAIPVGLPGCDIDHLMIGPAGVFTVNIKHHDGVNIAVAGYAMTVGGVTLPHLRNAKFEAERATRMLGANVDFEVPVRGCVVMLTNSPMPRVAYSSRPIGISVLTRRDVPRWFRRQPAILTASQVEALREAAEHPATWETVSYP